MGGTGTLRLTTRVDDLGWVVVEIADTGPGMPEHLQARAFEPFFTTKDVGVGTGLGLDISRRIIVDRHSGEITIDSVPGRTVLKVRLPVRTIDRERRLIATPRRRPSEAQPARPVDHREVTRCSSPGCTVSWVPGSGRTVYCWSVETTTSPIRCPAGNT